MNTCPMVDCPIMSRLQLTMTNLQTTLEVRSFTRFGDIWGPKNVEKVT